MKVGGGGACFSLLTPSVCETKSMNPINYMENNIKTLPLTSSAVADIVETFGQYMKRDVIPSKINFEDSNMISYKILSGYWKLECKQQNTTSVCLVFTHNY